MNRKIAIKRLTKSDLTFFIWHFENMSAGNQKAINLNSDVFVDSLYPGIQEAALKQDNRFPLDLHIAGPSNAETINLQRKIVKGPAYKNWRLDGEFVRDDPERFSSLREGDIALIEFQGETVPYAARIVLLVRSSVIDANAHLCLDRALGTKKMIAIDPGELDRLLDAAQIDDAHAIRSINVGEDIEDAIQGGLEGTQKLLRRRALRTVTRAELLAAQAQAEETGALGEEFVNEFLTLEKAAGRIADFRWVSRTNAIEPYDFDMVNLQRMTERLDAKSTVGPFTNPLHISMNELLHMAAADVPYRIYRVYEVSKRSAKLRISEPLVTFAVSLLESVSGLPSGASIDSFAIKPGSLRFNPEVDLVLPTADSD